MWDVKFAISGTNYDFDESRLTVAEARVIKKHAGFGLAEFGDGLRRGDPDAIVAMLFLVKRRVGEAVRWVDFDDFNLADIEALDEPSPESEPEAGPGPGPDPTGEPSTPE